MSIDASRDTSGDAGRHACTDRLREEASSTTNFARRFWDAAYADARDVVHWHREPPDAALLRALEGVGAGLRVLDLGCGTGAEAAWLAGRGFSVLGLELSLVALARPSSDRRPGADAPRWWCPVTGSVLALPIADASIDLLVDAGCLHSIGHASRGLWAREVQRVAAPGARLLIRGARFDDEEAGLIGVGVDRCRRWLAPTFRVEWTMPLSLPSEGGDLEGIAVLLARTDGGRV